MSGRSVPGTRWQGFLGRCVISLAVASAFVVTGVALVNRGIDERVAKITRVKLTLAQPPPGGANYLILGSDSRAFVNTEAEANAFGDPTTDPGQNSDTLMVAHIEPGAQHTFVVSFPRDLMVSVPGTPGLSRINSAYGIGGPQLVADTLKANFDIEINHYLEVDFKTFQEIVNEIGNVRVYFPGITRDLETGANTPYGAGCYALDGPAALAYVRSRTLEIYDPNYTDANGEHWRLLDQRADLDRITRQQTFMRKIAGLAIQKSLSDPFLAVSLTDHVLQYLTADQNLTRGDVNSLIRAFRTVDVNDPTSIRFETLPVDPDPNNPNVTLVPAADAEPVIEQLRTFGTNAPQPGTVAPADVKVQVTDATETNVGASVVSELIANRFKATVTVASPNKVAVTEIRYGYGQSEQAKALLPYFADAKLVPDPKATHAVHLILGASFQTITVPTTISTATPSAPATTVPDTTTTTVAPAPPDPCP